MSDGLTYSVQTNLSITTTSAFANTQDGLGNPYQVVTNITGTRLYTFLPNSSSVTSHVSFQPLSFSGGSQRFYPFALLASAPGVYTINTAPFWMQGDWSL